MTKVSVPAIPFIILIILFIVEVFFMVNVCSTVMGIFLIVIEAIRFGVAIMMLPKIKISIMEK